MSHTLSMTYRALPGANPADLGERVSLGRWETEGGALAKALAVPLRRYVRYRTNYLAIHRNRV
jgi:hypothetical protein